MKPDSRRWIRRAGIALIIALAGVGVFLLATADWGATSQWCTVTVSASFDGTDIYRGCLVDVRFTDNTDSGGGRSDGPNVAQKGHVPPPGRTLVPVRLSATVPRWQESLAHDAISQALAEIRRLLQAASPDVAGSDIQRLNSATAGERVLLSPEAVEMLRLGLKNDIESGFGLLELGDDYAVKNYNSLTLDLSPIARRYAIDKALARMESHGVAGGRIQIGDDSNTFGHVPP
ncbi:MAG: FAD:protein FMN transferase [Phycisphaerae bacterium]|nr:FAD:protein FMN transferase [Phycisphaerae bacterium]